MLKLGELYRDDGVWQGKQLVPAAWIAESTEPGTETSQYGLFWWLETTNRRHPYYLALGSQGQRIAIAPDLDLVMVILSATHEEPQMKDDAPATALVDQVITSIR